MSATVGRRSWANFSFIVSKANSHVLLSLDLKEDTPCPSHVGSNGKVLSKLESAVCWRTVRCRIARTAVEKTCLRRVQISTVIDIWSYRAIFWNCCSYHDKRKTQSQAWRLVATLYMNFRPARPCCGSCCNFRSQASQWSSDSFSHVVCTVSPILRTHHYLKTAITRRTNRRSVRVPQN
jgi:hypothetical protein